jgi:long-chain acyl-CoA synthetase
MEYFLELNKHKDGSIALVDDQNNQMTYGELRSFTEFFKSKIDERALVFHFSENSVPSVSLYIACLQSKLVPLLLSPQTDIELIQVLMNEYQPNYIIIPQNLQSNFKGQIIFESNGYLVLKTNDSVSRMHQDLAMLLPTSGSTGSPKLVRHSYLNINSSAKNVAHFFKIETSDRAFAFLPMFYTMGLSVINSYLSAGASVLLVKSSMTDANFWSCLKNGNITSITGVPYSFDILKKMRFFRMKLPTLKIVTQGGGKLSEELYEDCLNFAQQNQIDFIPTYGQTEGTARMAYLEPTFAGQKKGSIGKAIPNGTLSVINEQGIETFEGEATGEMVYRGQNVTLGYANCKDDLVLGDERNGILFTGDLVKRDADGFYFIVGRRSRFLKIYGIRVSLDDVEKLVSQSFETECACGGNDQKMFILITNPNLEKSVSEFIVQKTGLFHQSFQVQFVDKIPRNETGKVIFNGIL